MQFDYEENIYKSKIVGEIFKVMLFQEQMGQMFLYIYIRFFIFLQRNTIFDTSVGEINFREYLLFYTIDLPNCICL